MIEKWTRADNGNAISVVRGMYVYEVRVNATPISTHGAKDTAEQAFYDAVWANRRARS